MHVIIKCILNRCACWNLWAIFERFCCVLHFLLYFYYNVYVLRIENCHVHEGLMDCASECRKYSLFTGEGSWLHLYSRSQVFGSIDFCPFSLSYLTNRHNVVSDLIMCCLYSVDWCWYWFFHCREWSFGACDWCNYEPSSWHGFSCTGMWMDLHLQDFFFLLIYLSVQFVELCQSMLGPTILECWNNFELYRYKYEIHLLSHFILLHYYLEKSKMFCIVRFLNTVIENCDL